MFNTLRTRLCSILCCLLSVSPCLSKAETRIWTDVNGRTLEALLLKQSSESVTLRRSQDQQVFEIPLSNLSAADRRFLELNQASRKQAAHSQSASSFPSEGLKWEAKIDAPNDIKIEVLSEDNRESHYQYQSKHFRFTSNTKLSRKVVREFAEIFEATYRLVQQSPLNWEVRIPKDRFEAAFYHDEASYLAAGGLPGSAGVYIPYKQTMLVRLDALSTKKTSSSLTLDDGPQGTLIHEITHQVQHHCLRYLPTWLAEGYAEYVEVIPFDRGKFRLDRIELRSGRSRPDYMDAPSQLLEQSRSDWNARFELDPMGVTRQYRSAHLLTYYFMHLDGDGDGRRLWTYLRALESGQSNPTAILLDGRTPEQLNEDLLDAFKREDLELEIY